MSWFLLAVWLQALDAYTACYNLNRGGIEYNPILGNTCKTVIIRKVMIAGIGYTLFDNKKVSIALAVSGSVGISITIALNVRD